MATLLLPVKIIRLQISEDRIPCVSHPLAVQNIPRKILMCHKYSQRPTEGLSKRDP